MPTKSRQPFVVTETGPLEGPGIFETYFSEPVKRAVEAAAPKIKAGAQALIPDTVENWFTDILTKGRLMEETNRLERSGLTPAQIEAYRADLAAGRAVAIPSAAPTQTLTVGSEFTESANPVAQLMGGADPSGPALAAGDLIGDPERFGAIAKKAKALLESWHGLGMKNMTLADAVDYLKRKPQGDPNLTKAMEFIPLSPIDEQAQAISAAPEQRLKLVQEMLQIFKQEGMDFGAANRELKRLGYDPAEYEDLIGATLGERRNQLTRLTDEDYLEMAKRKKVSPYKAEAGVDPGNPLGIGYKETEADLAAKHEERLVNTERERAKFKTEAEYQAAVRRSYEDVGYDEATINQLMGMAEKPKAKYVSSMKGKTKEIRYYELPYDVGGSKRGTRVTEDFLKKHGVEYDH